MKGYGAGRTQGRSDVTSSPNSYSLYTKSQYDGNYDSGYGNGRSQGQSDVTSNPNGYGLYTQNQYDTHYVDGYSSGVSEADNRANSDSVNWKDGYNTGVRTERFTNTRYYGCHEVSSGVNPFYIDFTGLVPGGRYFFVIVVAQQGGGYEARHAGYGPSVSMTGGTLEGDNGWMSQSVYNDSAGEKGAGAVIRTCQAFTATESTVLITADIHNDKFKGTWCCYLWGTQ